MDPARSWETLFRHAVEILDAEAPNAGGALDAWTFGGGTALMRRYRHRISKDVDIFLPDPQCLGYLSPRVNDKVDGLVHGAYDEQTHFLKLIFPELGEIDFIVAPPETSNPAEEQEVLGRTVEVETPREVIAKKLRYRAAEFKGRDIFDCACVIHHDPAAFESLGSLLSESRVAVMKRIATQEAFLRREFEGVDVLEFDLDFDSCVELLDQSLR